jgi:hypothetical protein
MISQQFLGIKNLLSVGVGIKNLLSVGGIFNFERVDFLQIRCGYL